jgi:polysaccharide biosynthesis/export protein
LLSITGCKLPEKYSKDFNYFQKGLDSSVNKMAYVEHRFKENDLISIQVIAGSIRQEDATVFNIVGVSLSGQQTGVGNSNANYLVDANGYVDVPKVGKIKAAGLTKVELANTITSKISDEVKNPLVIVKLSQFKVNVLGEVKRPGVVTFRTDKANILEALAEAGDLTDGAKREDITLMREMNGKYETYKIDLRKTDFINSPSFQMYNNDVIYVGANVNKLKTIEYKGVEQAQKVALILSIITTAALLVNVTGIFR